MKRNTRFFTSKTVSCRNIVRKVTWHESSEDGTWHSTCQRYNHNSLIVRESRLPFMLLEECDQVVKDVSPFPPPPQLTFANHAFSEGSLTTYFPVCFWHNIITSHLDPSWQLLLINILMLLTKYLNPKVHRQVPADVFLCPSLNSNGLVNKYKPSLRITLGDIVILLNFQSSLPCLNLHHSISTTVVWTTDKPSSAYCLRQSLIYYIKTVLEHALWVLFEETLKLFI